MLKHILIRLGVIIAAPTLLLCMTIPLAGGDAMSQGLILLYSILFSFFLVLLGLIIDSILLYKKKLKTKFWASIIILLISPLLSFGILYISATIIDHMF